MTHPTRCQDPDDIASHCPRDKFSVDLLNVMHGPFTGWHPVTAQKQHMDFFGQHIKEGEQHYIRPTGAGFTDSARLTALSMDRMLWLTFGANPGLVERCTEVVKKQQAELLKSMRLALNTMTDSDLPGRP